LSIRSRRSQGPPANRAESRLALPRNGVRCTGTHLALLAVKEQLALLARGALSDGAVPS
jgi:hypothetical protein